VAFFKLSSIGNTIAKIIAANEKVFAMAGYSLNVQPGQMLN